MGANTHYDYFSSRVGGSSLTSADHCFTCHAELVSESCNRDNVKAPLRSLRDTLSPRGRWKLICHPEVPKARQYTGAFWNFSCYFDAVAEGSQEKIPQRVRDDKLVVGRHYYADRKIYCRVSKPDLQVTMAQNDINVSEAHCKHKPHFTHYTHSTHAKRVAFTLAEVLITLGIIGIVAAMTIPTLVANYQEKTWSTSAQVFERKFEEALKTMNTQQVLAGYSSTEEFVGKLSKHFKINKICSNNDIMSCFEDEITWDVLDISAGDNESGSYDMTTITTAAALGQDDWNSDAVGVQFANGTTGIIAYNPDCREQPFSNQFTGTSCVSLVYDTNGFKSPNSFNKDVRGINSFLKSCAFRSGSTCFSAPFKPDPITKAECEQLKGDLGIKYCYYDDDYWAGAVKACGGVSKMPTMAQIADIANYVYNTSGIGVKENVSNVTLDYDKVAELGFTVSNGSSFNVWSGEEFRYDYAYYHYFGPRGTGWYGISPSRNSSQQTAVCLGD